MWFAPSTSHLAEKIHLLEEGQKKAGDSVVKYMLHLKKLEKENEEW